MPGDHINERSCAIGDVLVARDLRGASTETTGLFAHVLPQASAGGAGRATPAAAVHHDGRDLKTLSGANELTTSCTTRDRTRGSAGAGRARRCRSGGARRVI